MPRTATLFLNRNSGTRADVTALLEAAEAESIEVVALSPNVDCAAEIRERMRRGVRLFIAAGGDGTVHHVMQPLVHSEATLAVLPLGTYNHFARDLGIPLDWRAALDVALHGANRQVDTARINTRFFVNNVSLGLYPDLVAKREAHGRDYPRWRARLYAFFTTLRKYRDVTLGIEADTIQEVIRTHVFMVSNNSYDLERIGIEAPRTTLTEGRLSVYWLPHTSRWRMTGIVARYLAGRVREIPGFRSFRTMRMKIRSARATLRIGIDGELFTLATPLILTTVPQSLEVRVAREETGQR